MNLLHLIARQWRQRRARTALSIASVAIAAAAVLGVMLAQTSVRMAYRKLLAATEGQPTLEIVSAEGTRFDAGAVPKLTHIPGVQAATPLVTRATMARSGGKRFRTVLLGVAPDDAPAWAMLPLTEGTVCRKDGEALISADLAKRSKIEVGDRLTIIGSRGPRSSKIVGFVNSAALREMAPAAALIMPLEAVQGLYSLGDRINRIRVVLASIEQRDAVREALEARLPKTLAVQAPVAQLELAGGILRSTELALSFAGALSLAMAAFIVLNTLRMNFGERRRDMAVLRVLGVTSRQLVGLQLVEGLLLGFIGALLGIPIGLALGTGLASLMQQLVEAEIPTPETPYWMLAAALVVGPLVAGMAALVPALQSRGVSPVEALGDVEVRRGERFPWWSVIGGAAVWSVAVVLLLLVWLERLSTEAAIPAGVLMLVGFIAVIPALLRPVVRSLETILGPWLKMEGDFAAEQLLHRATRTGLTVGVLVVAISSGVGMGNAIINNVDDVRGWYRRMTAGDIMLSGPSADEVSEVSRDDTDVRQLISDVPGVDFVVETNFLPARAEGVPTVCVVHEFSPNLELPWAVSAENDAHFRARLKAGDAVIGAALAKRLGLSAGDTLRLELQGRQLALPVAGTVRDYTAGGMAVFVDRDRAVDLVSLGRAQVYTVTAQPAAAIDPLVETMTKLVDAEGLNVHSYAVIRGQLDVLIAGIVGALWGLLAIGFVIGGLAVANTLSMSVFEQTRELGLLRIIGMTRPQMRKMIFCESLLLGVLGTLLGTLAGLTTAWIIHLCNEPLLGHAIPFTLHTWLVAANAVACLMITLLAAWLPGERAARLDFLSAIAYE